MNTSLFWTISLLAIVALWGWTYVGIKDAVSAESAPAFLLHRCALAALVTLPFSLGSGQRGSMLHGMIGGMLLVCILVSQTAALMVSSATNSAFICATAVIWTLLANRILFGHHVTRGACLAALSSVAGTALLVGSFGPVGVGDLFSLICAIAIGLYFTWLGHKARHHAGIGLACGQFCIATGILFLLSFVTQENISVPSDPTYLPVVLICGIGATAGAFWLQGVAQSHLNSAITAVIFGTEPVFACFFSLLYGYAVPGPVAWIGMAMSVGAIPVMIFSTQRHVTSVECSPSPRAI